ncbi:MAG TPA: tetratricopeptide repeat protein [Pyrinomonadaceae bacterium]|jgi:tetratricopeptide (TPR) repeat protein|nr:tetratricopeptide repeat protein [Pyrinomonadaceae bacterium]
MNKYFLRPALLLLIALSFTIVVSARDEWTQVRSKNFFLIGNAPEKDIRKVATRLEQFRETFRQLFASINLVSPTPTNVIVFKSSESYKQFKPKRSDGKIDNFVAGYFQSGQDVNYITLSTEGEDADTFRTIFHEYVHFIVNSNFGKGEVPPWFNEGLAEYYEMFAIEGDQVVKLGLPNGDHLRLLNMTRLIPLAELFAVRNSQLSESGDNSRSVFYAESWALIHYLSQTGKSAGLAKFLTSVLKNTPQQQAFKDAFQEDYPQMEGDLKKYVAQGRFNFNRITFNAKLTFDADMTVAPLPAPTANAYLGDLLYHVSREDDAEPYLMQALAGEPNSAMANTAMGMVRYRQRKFDEARKYLETAVSSDQNNAFALYRYAFLLSREGRDEYGISHEFSTETIAKMRDALTKAIARNPGFTESYDLLAFVDLVASENLDEAASAMHKALKYQPGNEKYSMRLAEVYVRQEKFDEAQAIADKISKGSDDAEVLQSAGQITRSIREMKEYRDRVAEFERRRKAGSERATLGPKTDPAMTRDEIERAKADLSLREMNNSLRIPQPGETHLIGHVQKIDCRKRPLTFTISSAEGAFTLTSRDFESLTLNTFVADADRIQVGCDSSVGAFNAVVTYRPTSAAARDQPRGEIVAIEFVPEDFRIMTEDELTRQTPPRLVRIEDVDATGVALPPGAQRQEPTRDGTEQRDAIRRQLVALLRQAGDGEKRDIGYLQKIECGSKGVYFIMRTAAGDLRLLNASPETLAIRLFTPDLDGVRFGCTVKPLEYPAVFVYKTTPDPKGKTQGTILSLDFVPKSFTLD